MVLAGKLIGATTSNTITTKQTLVAGNSQLQLQ
jgi:hypothetical protein